MLFHVRMNINLPPDMSEAEATALKAKEKEIAQGLQSSGKWCHLWRIAGQYANISIFDVASVDELHTAISTLPLFSIYANWSNAIVQTSIFRKGGWQLIHWKHLIHSIEIY